MGLLNEPLGEMLGEQFDVRLDGRWVEMNITHSQLLVLMKALFLSKPDYLGFLKTL